MLDERTNLFDCCLSIHPTAHSYSETKTVMWFLHNLEWVRKRVAIWWKTSHVNIIKLQKVIWSIRRFSSKETWKVQPESDEISPLVGRNSSLWHSLGVLYFFSVWCAPTLTRCSLMYWLHLQIANKNNNTLFKYDVYSFTWTRNNKE